MNKMTKKDISNAFAEIGQHLQNMGDKEGLDILTKIGVELGIKEHDDLTLIGAKAIAELRFPGCRWPDHALDKDPRENGGEYPLGWNIVKSCIRSAAEVVRSIEPIIRKQERETIARYIDEVPAEVSYRQDHTANIRSGNYLAHKIFHEED